MKLLRITNRDLVYDYFRANLGLSWTADFRGCLFVPEYRRGETSAMDHVAIAVAYNSFNGRLCSMHAVIKNPEFVSRRVVSEVFEFPFVACKVNHVLAPVDSTNEEALEFDRRLGFRELYRFPEGATHGDLVIFSMSKEECRWLGKRKLQ